VSDLAPLCGAVSWVIVYGSESVDGRHRCNNASEWAGSVVWCCVMDRSTRYLLPAHNWSNCGESNLL